MTASTKTSTRAAKAFNPATTGVEEVLAASREAVSKKARSEPAKNVAEITGIRENSNYSETRHSNRSAHRKCREFYRFSKKFRLQYDNQCVAWGH